MKPLIWALTVGSVWCNTFNLAMAQNTTDNKVISRAHALSQAFESADSALSIYKKSKTSSNSTSFNESLQKITQRLEELKSVVSNDPRKQQVLRNVDVLVHVSLKILTDLKNQSDHSTQKEFHAEHMSRSPASLTNRINEELTGLTQDNANPDTSKR